MLAGCRMGVEYLDFYNHVVGIAPNAISFNIQQLPPHLRQQVQNILLQNRKISISSKF